ncbi:MAG: DUF2203 domain-containing protein [Actinomycetota bacterium]
MTRGRVYTVEEANAMLPELRERLERIRAARQTLLRTAEKIRGTVANDGGGRDGGRDYWDAKQILGSEVARLAELEIALRDPESGLVDFPGDRDGDPVFLCWRADEDQVGHWHDQSTGFSGRKPL